MPSCSVCAAREQRLKEAVVGHWHEMPLYWAVLATTSRPADIDVRETKPAVSTFTRFYLRNQPGGTQ